MKKSLLIVLFLQLATIIYADDVYISENFKNHFCKEIQKVSYSNQSNWKEDLLRGLKEKAKVLGANSLIRVEFHSNSFRNNSVEGVAANCDISKSPEFFIKSPSLYSNTLTKYNIDEDNDNKKFIGIEVGKTEATFTGSVPSIGYSETFSDKGEHYGIKIGEFFKADGQNYRIGFSLQQYNTSDNADIFHTALSADYLNSLGDSAFQTFIGSHLAFFRYEKSGLKESGADVDTTSINKTAIGFQFGGLYNITKNHNLEIGYRITPMSASGSNSITYSGTTYPIKFVIEDVKAWYFGLSSKF